MNTDKVTAYMRLCTVDGCRRVHRSLGYCLAHYQRLRRSGSTDLKLVQKTPVKHGLSKHPMYITWGHIIQRCENPDSPNYKRYGARGIKICPQWRQDFSAFLRDIGERPKGMSLDRINVDGDYEPGNMRWTSRTVQARNTRPVGYKGFKGVRPDKSYPKRPFRVDIVYNREGVRLRAYVGNFTTFDEAVAARKNAELKYWGYVREDLAKGKAITKDLQELEV